MTISTSSFQKFLFPGLSGAFQNDYRDYEKQYTQLFTVINSQRAYEENIGFSGTGLAPVKGEGAAMEYEDMEQGFLARYTHVAFALGSIITYEMLSDNLYDNDKMIALGSRKSKYLARSQAQTWETVAANVYNRAFNSSFKGADATELLSTSHPFKTGGTYSNKIAVNADLSEASLEEVCINISKYTDSKGLNIAVKPICLVVPPDLKFEAERILGSTLQNDTANNAVNALRSTGMIPKVVVNQYLTSTKAWFVRTDCPEGMKLYSREAPMFENDNDFDTKNMRNSSYSRFSVGYDDPYALNGSAGA